MPRFRKPKRPALQCRFDYAALEGLMKTHGGIIRCCKAAGVHHGSYYYVKNTQPLPLSRPIRNLLDFLDLPPEQIHRLFVKAPQPRSKK